jgi:hypothetical protein
MYSVYQLVKQALKMGFLSAETEAQIQELFDRPMSLGDLEALINLQKAVNRGHVKREVNERQKSLV